MQELFQEIQKSYPSAISKLKLERNDFLIRAGQTEKHIYLVDDGSLRVFYLTEQEEHTIRLAYKNSFFTTIDSFLTGEPTQYYIQALKKTTVTTIEKSVFMELANRSSEMLKSYNSILEELTLQQMEREIDLLTSSPIERFKRILKRSPQVFREIPHRYIAAYLRMTPETLSRLKKS